MNKKLFVFTIFLIYLLTSIPLSAVGSTNVEEEDDDIIICPNCGESFKSGLKFCPYCEYQMWTDEEQPQFNYCPNCGAELEEGVKFCPRCGYDLIEDPLKDDFTHEPELKSKSISQISPFVGIFGSFEGPSADYIFGANIYFKKSKFNIDNTLYLHPSGGLYLYFSNKVEIVVTPPTTQFGFGPFVGVDFEGYLYEGSLIFIGPNLGLYFKIQFGNTVWTTLKPSFYITPTWYIGSWWGESDSGYLSTNAVFDFDTRFYFNETFGLYTNFKLKVRSVEDFGFSNFYLSFGPSFNL